MRRTSDVLHQAYRVLAEVTAQPLDRLRQTFDEYITKNPPWDPKSNRPHTPDTAIQDWLTGVTPFLQAVHPHVPFERYKFEPHTRGLDEFNDVGELLKAVIALHTRAKYNTTTLYNRIDQDELVIALHTRAKYNTTTLYNRIDQDELARDMEKSQALAPTMVRDLENQFAQGRGVRADGTFGVMPGHTPAATPNLTSLPFPTTSTTTTTDTQGQADAPPRSRWRELLWGRTAAVADLDDVLDGLGFEFHEWARDNKKTNPYDGRWGDPRGPIGYWPNIEEFLQERYPAAHKGLSEGFEQAQYLMDLPPDTDLDGYFAPGFLNGVTRYDTGPEAVAAHGYDPKEIAAALLALHSATHPGRGEAWQAKDIDRLSDIAQTRYRMQRSYDSRPRTALHRAYRALAEATAVLEKPTSSSSSVTDVLSEWESERGAPRINEISTEKCSTCGGLGFDFDTGDSCPDCHEAGKWIPPDVEERIGPHAEKLEKALYQEFMDWWPTSQAAKDRDPATSGTQWTHNPQEPITHWLNAEDFLRERYPEAATGSQYGGEQAAPLLERRIRTIRDEDLPTPEWMEARGYTGHGNVLTQLMLNLHNRLNGRTWRDTDDKRKYYELMMRHIGPDAVGSPRRAARFASGEYNVDYDDTPYWAAAWDDEDDDDDDPDPRRRTLAGRDDFYQPQAFDPDTDEPMTDDDVARHPVVQEFQRWMDDTAGFDQADPVEILNQYLHEWKPEHKVYHDMLQQYVGIPITQGYWDVDTYPPPPPSPILEFDGEVFVPDGYEEWCDAQGIPPEDRLVPGKHFRELEPVTHRPVNPPPRGTGRMPWQIRDEERRRNPPPPPPPTLTERLRGWLPHRRTTTTARFTACAHDEDWWGR